MSFSLDQRKLRNEKIYSAISHLKMSVGAENTVDTSAPRDSERIEEPNNGISHELIEEKIKANLGPLNKQLSTLTQLQYQLIQETWHVIPQWRILVLSRNRQGAHPVMKREPPEPCRQEKLGV